MRKLKIGDKIKWNQGGGIIYTVLDIDTSRNTDILKTPNREYVFINQILLQWYDYDGKITQCWCYSLDEINQLISSGLISIVNSEIEPCKHLTKFSFQ